MVVFRDEEKSKDENSSSFISQPFCARTSGFGPKEKILLDGSTRVSFYIILCQSRHFSVTPATSLSLSVTYRLTVLLTVLTVHHHYLPLMRRCVSARANKNKDKQRTLVLGGSGNRRTETG